MVSGVVGVYEWCDQGDQLVAGGARDCQLDIRHLPRNSLLCNFDCEVSGDHSDQDQAARHKYYPDTIIVTIVTIGITIKYGKHMFTVDCCRVTTLYELLAE